MSRFLITLFTLLLSAGAWAQNAYTLKGKVFENDTKEPVIGAAVRLLTPNDSTYVRGASSGRDGSFTLKQVAPGSYILHINFMGFEPIYERVEVRDVDLQLGEFRLSEAVTRLNILEVTAQANPVTVKKDTIQFNANAFRVRKGANLEELIKRIPGMEVDEEGNISYNGEAIERIEMNGRNFFSNDPQMATRNLPSAMIKNLQVVDKKSDETRLTGVDDGEKIKVLNLEIKEEMNKGVIANAKAGYGTKQRYNNNLMLNYFNDDARYTLLGELNNIDGVRRGQGDRVTRRVGANFDKQYLDKTLKVTGEAFYNNLDHTTEGTSRTEQLLGGDNRTIEEGQDYDFHRSQYLDFSSRIEWEPNKSTMMVFEPEARFNWNDENDHSTFTTTNQKGDKINEGNSKGHGINDSQEVNGTLHFRHTFNDLGRNIYARVNGEYNHTWGNSYLESTTQFYNGTDALTRDQFTDTFQKGYRLGANLSYLEPFNRHWAAQLSYRVNYNNRENDRATYNKDADGNYTLLDDIYSQGSYSTSVIQKMEALLRYSFGKSYISLGFGANPTKTHNISTKSKKVNFDKTRTSWHFAPSMIVELRPSEDWQVRMRYSGHTEEPGMSQINPSLVVVSPLSQVVGNPDLSPAFSHHFHYNIRLNKMEKRQTFSLDGWWGFVQNAIASNQTIDPETGITRTTYENITGNQMLFTSFMVNTPIGGSKSKWNSFTFGFVNYNKDKGFVNGTLNTANVWRPSLAQRFTYSGSWLQGTLGGFVMLQDVTNSFTTQLNRQTWDFNTYAEAICTLPWDLSFTTRVTYQDAKGYDDGLKRNYWVWDATLSWSFLKAKNATIELAAYDLLRQRTTFRRHITANKIVDNQVNGITSYAMLTFTYRFNNMGGKDAPITGSENFRNAWGRDHHHHH